MGAERAGEIPGPLGVRARYESAVTAGVVGLAVPAIENVRIW